MLSAVLYKLSITLCSVIAKRILPMLLIQMTFFLNHHQGNHSFQDQKNKTLLNYAFTFLRTELVS